MLAIEAGGDSGIGLIRGAAGVVVVVVVSVAVRGCCC